jgi:hypothetical protein
MNVNLLRAKMALKGDFTWTALADFLGLSRASLTGRLADEIDWTVPEIRKIVIKYDLSAEETCKIFGFKIDDEN